MYLDQTLAQQMGSVKVLSEKVKSHNVCVDVDSEESVDGILWERGVRGLLGVSACGQSAERRLHILCSS